MKNKVTEEFSILTGKSLKVEQYLKTWELDNKVFDKDNQITKKMALDWFKYSGRSTFVLWNNKEDSLVGYLTVYLVRHSFANKYIINNASYKNALTADVFCSPRKGADADLYVFSTIILPKYQNKKLDIKDKNSNMYGKSAFKVLNEAFLDWVCEIKKAGVSINYVFGEKATDDGEKYLRSMELQPCFAFGNECKFAKLYE